MDEEGEFGTGLWERIEPLESSIPLSFSFFVLCCKFLQAATGIALIPVLHSVIQSRFSSYFLYGYQVSISLKVRCVLLLFRFLFLHCL